MSSEPTLKISIFGLFKGNATGSEAVIAHFMIVSLVICLRMKLVKHLRIRSYRPAFSAAIKRIRSVAGRL